MKFILATLVVFCIGCSSFTTIPYSSVQPLTVSERILVLKIVKKARNSGNEAYYLGKLQELLAIKEATKEETAAMILASTKKGVQLAEVEIEKDVGSLSYNEYFAIPEINESIEQYKWEKYRPYSGSAYYYVARSDPNNLFVHLRIHLTGDSEQIKNIISVKRNIESHVSIPGFSFVVEFVGFSGDDIFEVSANPDAWPNSRNFAGGNYKVYAHEIFHLMGLDDEYNLIESHAKNPYLSVSMRLKLFLAQMDRVISADARDGIMSNHNNKALQRHVCIAVGEGEACVKERKAKYYLSL